MSSNQNTQNETYDMLLDLVKTRHSVRKFKPDPIPDDTIDKILEVARWAMSGANSQPWEFIVVTDPRPRKSCATLTRNTIPTSSSGWSSSASTVCAIPPIR